MPNAMPDERVKDMQFNLFTDCRYFALLLEYYEQEAGMIRSKNQVLELTVQFMTKLVLEQTNLRLKNSAEAKEFIESRFGSSGVKPDAHFHNLKVDSIEGGDLSVGDFLRDTVGKSRRRDMTKVNQEITTSYRKPGWSFSPDLATEKLSKELFNLSLEEKYSYDRFHSLMEKPDGIEKLKLLTLAIEEATNEKEIEKKELINSFMEV